MKKILEKTFLTYLFNKNNLYSILGGVVFVVIFYYGYSSINSDWYEYRDDGVITMSHGKNLVDYGFIGVSPSGPKVEGHSAPVEFFVYTFLYKIFGITYATYSNLQTYLCTFLLGFFFIRFFKESKWVGILLSISSASILTFYPSFFEWHASGMENAITHVLFLLSAYIIVMFVIKEKINHYGLKVLSPSAMD